MTRILSAAALLWLTAAPLSAAPATPEAAAGIEAALRTYLGQTPGVVTVVPEGESYALTLDPAPWIALADGAFTAEVTPIHLALAANGDGTWTVTGDEPFSVRAEVPGALKLDLAVASLAFDCRFDPALKACLSSTGVVSGVSVAETLTDAPGTTTEVSYRIGRIATATTAAPAASGTGVDATARYAASELEETLRMTPPAEGGGTATEIAVTAAAYDVTSEIRAMRTEALYGLLAWFVAHPTEAAIGADPEGLKSAIRAALPLWDNVAGTGEVRTVAVATPFGAGSAESVGFAIDLGGVQSDGHLRESLAVKGLKLPAELMPDWVPPLLPSEATVDVAVSGFDLAAPAAMFLDAVGPDFEADEAFEVALLAAFLPEGKVTVSLAPQGVVTPTFTLDAEGGFDAGPGRMPEGRVTLGATGIDAALEALGQAPEEVRSGAVPGVMMARGMAKPAGPGRFVWEIGMTAEGRVLVNGADMSALAGLQ